jgi:hypothetical protein
MRPARQSACHARRLRLPGCQVCWTVNDRRRFDILMKSFDFRGFGRTMGFVALQQLAFWPSRRVSSVFVRVLSHSPPHPLPEQ